MKSHRAELISCLWPKARRLQNLSFSLKTHFLVTPLALFPLNTSFVQLH